MKSVLAVFLVILATGVFGRTINIEKVSVQVSEESTESDLTKELLQDFLDIDENEVEYGGCKNGKCKFCAGMGRFKLCFVATIQSQAILLEVSFNGHDFIKKTISVKNPPPICYKKLPFLPDVTDICVELKNIDLQQASGCVYVSFKANIGPVHHHFDFKIGCFKLKKEDDDITDDIAEILSGSIDADTEEVKEGDSVLATTTPVPNKDDDYILLFKSLNQMKK